MVKLINLQFILFTNKLVYVAALLSYGTTHGFGNEKAFCPVPKLVQIYPSYWVTILLSQVLETLVKFEAIPIAKPNGIVSFGEATEPLKASVLFCNVKAVWLIGNSMFPFA